MVDLVGVGVESEQRVDEVALARRLGADLLGLLERREAAREIFVWRGRVRVVEHRERNAPQRDGALRIGLQRVLEDGLRLAIPERMLVAHGAIKAPLCNLIA